DFSPLHGSKRTNFTLDFTPWGLDNRTPLRSSIPGTITVGAPVQTASTSLNPGTSTGGANLLGRACNNCWAVPAGTGSNFNGAVNNGVGPTAAGSASTLNWSTFAVAANGGPTNQLGGTQNEFNPYSIAWYDAQAQRNVIVG